MLRLLFVTVMLIISSSASALTVGSYSVVFQGVVYPAMPSPLTACSHPSLLAAFVSSGKSFSLPTGIVAYGDAYSFQCTAYFSSSVYTTYVVSFHSPSLRANYSFSPVLAPVYDPAAVSASGVPADYSSVVAGLITVNDSLGLISSQVVAANPVGMLSGYAVNDILLAFFIVVIWSLGFKAGLTR